MPGCDRNQPRFPACDGHERRVSNCSCTTPATASAAVMPLSEGSECSHPVMGMRQGPQWTLQSPHALAIPTSSTAISRLHSRTIQAPRGSKGVRQLSPARGARPAIVLKVKSPLTVDEARWLLEGANLGSAIGSIGDDALDRNATVHLTVSAVVVLGSELLVVDRQGHLSLPGGHVERSDRSLISAARRELAEETGVAEATPTAMRPLHVSRHAADAVRCGVSEHVDFRFGLTCAGPRPEAKHGAHWEKTSEASGRVYTNQVEAVDRMLAAMETFTAASILKWIRKTQSAAHSASDITSQPDLFTALCTWDLLASHYRGWDYSSASNGRVMLRRGNSVIRASITEEAERPIGGSVAIWYPDIRYAVRTDESPVPATVVHEMSQLLAAVHFALEGNNRLVWRPTVERRQFVTALLDGLGWDYEALVDMERRVNESVGS